MVSGIVQSVIQIGNNLTANFCDDRWRGEVRNEPKLRPICRLILTLTTISIIVLATVFLFRFRTDSFRSMRYLGNDLLPTIYNRGMNVSSGQNAASTPRPGKLLCLCDNLDNNAWSSFMSMFLLSKNSENGFDKYTINNAKNFCWEEWQKLSADYYLYWACPHLVDSILATGTQILASALLDADSFVDAVTKSIEQSIESVLSNYRILLNLDSKQWYVVEEIGEAFREMKNVFTKNPSSSTEEDYWNYFQNASNKAPDGRAFEAVLAGRALSMELSWTAYLEQCKPAYCDEVIPNSQLSRILSAVAQVGGLISAILFAVRTVAWPALRLLGGWSIQQSDEWKTTLENYLDKKYAYIEENHPPPHMHNESRKGFNKNMKEKKAQEKNGRGITNDEIGLARYSSYINLNLDLPSEDLSDFHAETNVEAIR